MQRLLGVVVSSCTRSMNLRATATAAWSQVAFVLVFALATAAVCAQSAVKGWGQLVFDSTWNEQRFVKIAAGYGFTVAQRSDGSALAWGDNHSGQCNMPALPAGLTYVEIGAGWAHAAARRSDGSVVAWGDNTYGQCNVPALPSGIGYGEVAAGSQHTVARRSDGSVIAWGDNTFGQCNVTALPPGSTYGAVAAGGQHTVAL